MSERKLAVLLHSDVVGSTALVQLDETRAHQRIQDAFRQFSETIASYKGIAHEIRGDALLAEFARASDAVSASLAFQAAHTIHIEQLSDDIRPVLRIGIAMGEVVVADNTVTGEGVVLAQRLEQLTEPGGVCIQGAAYETVPKRLPFDYENLGERELKGFDEPIKVYAVRLKPGGTMPEVETGVQPSSATLDLPDKPSIAALPFTNMSSDPEQEYFSDGITEDIITELSRFRELFVIARNSSFSYKGKAMKVQDIATDLGVRYVLEGSVRVSGKRIRVTAQLIDAETGHHVWSERYDRELTDLFALQDEIAQTVAGAVAGRLKLTAEARAERKPIENLEAYDYVLRGQSIIADTKENNLRARRAYEKAIELDSALTTTHVGLARSYIIEWLNSWSDPNDRPLDHALEYAAKAVSLDNTDSKAQLILGSALEMRGEHEEAKVHLERALELNPNDADAFALMGIYLQQTCKPQEAIDSYLKAMRLNPYYPAWYVWKLGTAYYDVRQYEDALIPLREAIDRNPKFKRARLALVATYAQLDRIEEARNQVERLLADHPDASMKHERQWKFWSDEEGQEHWLEGLRKASLPE